MGSDEKVEKDVFGFNQVAPMSKYKYIMGVSNISNESTGRPRPDTDLECGSLGYFEKREGRNSHGKWIHPRKHGIYSTPTTDIR